MAKVAFSSVTLVFRVQSTPILRPAVSECRPCQLVGTEALDEGSESCTPCAPDFFASEVGAGCLPCPPGTTPKIRPPTNPILDNLVALEQLVPGVAPVSQAGGGMAACFSIVPVVVDASNPIAIAQLTMLLPPNLSASAAVSASAFLGLSAASMPAFDFMSLGLPMSECAALASLSATYGLDMPASLSAMYGMSPSEYAAASAAASVSLSLSASALASLSGPNVFSAPGALNPTVLPCWWTQALVDAPANTVVSATTGTELGGSNAGASATAGTGASAGASAAAGILAGDGPAEDGPVGVGYYMCGPVFAS